MDLKEKLEQMKQDETENNAVDSNQEFTNPEEIVFDTSEPETNGEENQMEFQQEDEETETSMEAQEENVSDVDVFDEVNKPEKEEYTPNFKYKAVGEEYEFDEELKPIIKDKETEEKFRKIYAKAKGLDFYEKKHKKLEDEYNNLIIEHETLSGDSRKLATVVEDFDSKIRSGNKNLVHRAMNEIGLNDQSILDLARHVLNIRQLSPDQQSAYHQQYEQQNQIKQYEQRLNEQDQRLQQVQVQAAQDQYNAFLSTQQDLIDEYEVEMGRGKNSFSRDFAAYGKILVDEGKNPDLNTALSEFKKFAGLGKRKPVQPTQPVTQVQKVESIPNLQGSGHSPIQKGFKSMDDLRNYMWK